MHAIRTTSRLQRLSGILKTMKKIKILVLPLLVLSLCLIASTACSAETEPEGVEKEYFAILDAWVDGGGLIDKIQERVVRICGKLVLLTADEAERDALRSTDLKEFHFRVNICTKITVNRAHPDLEPELKNKEVVSLICDESGISLFGKLCRHSGLK